MWGYLVAPSTHGEVIWSRYAAWGYLVAPCLRLSGRAAGSGGYLVAQGLFGRARGYLVALLPEAE